MRSPGPVHLRAIQAIWDRLADFTAAETDAALEYLLGAVAKLVGAQDAFWIGAVRMPEIVERRRDRQFGWRVRVVRLWRPVPADVTFSQRLIKQQESPETSMTTVAVAAAAGRFRVARVKDLVDVRAFRRTRHYRDTYEARGVVDRLFVSFPLNEDAESHFCFDRLRPRRGFGRREAELAGFALRAIKGFHRQAMLSHGLGLVRSPLSPMQRRVLQLLLTDASQKKIAAVLGHSPATTHKHVMEIFRRFGVQGRTALMALWLQSRP